MFMYIYLLLHSTSCCIYTTFVCPKINITEFHVGFQRFVLCPRITHHMVPTVMHSAYNMQIILQVPQPTLHHSMEGEMEAFIWMMFFVMEMSKH